MSHVLLDYNTMSKQILTTEECIRMQLPISFLGCRVGRLTKVRFWLYVLQVIDHLSPRLAASDEVGGRGRR